MLEPHTNKDYGWIQQSEGCDRVADIQQHIQRHSGVARARLLFCHQVEPEDLRHCCTSAWSWTLLVRAFGGFFTRQYDDPPACFECRPTRREDERRQEERRHPSVRDKPLPILMGLLLLVAPACLPACLFALLDAASPRAACLVACLTGMAWPQARGERDDGSSRSPLAYV